MWRQICRAWRDDVDTHRQCHLHTTAGLRQPAVVSLMALDLGLLRASGTHLFDLIYKICTICYYKPLKVNKLINETAMERHPYAVTG